MLYLHILYDDFDLINYEESKKYNLIGLISNIGGIGGIWLGISIVAVVEAQ